MRNVLRVLSWLLLAATARGSHDSCLVEMTTRALGDPVPHSARVLVVRNQPPAEITSFPLAVVVHSDPLAPDTAAFVARYRDVVPILYATGGKTVDALAYAKILEAGYRRVVTEDSEIDAAAREARRAHACRIAAQRELALAMAARGIAVASPAMLEACFRATQSAGARSNILILGATGVGKEKIARSLHDRGGAERPFVIVNSATLQSALAESLLFGHEKGAFTGAATATRGHFREAHGGTLVLDEVQNMPLDVQAKLLRVLQERTARSVGGKEDYSIDVRVIAISNRPLRDMVAKGEFREDLFHRLGQVLLEIPPLSQRPEDLVLQARFFLRIFQGETVTVTNIDPVVVEALRLYGWPGNTRELENLMHEALSRHEGTGPDLVFEDLPPWFRRALIAQSLSNPTRLE